MAWKKTTTCKTAFWDSATGKNAIETRDCAGYVNKTGWVVRKSHALDYHNFKDAKRLPGSEWVIVEPEGYAVCRFTRMADAKQWVDELIAAGDISHDAMRAHIAEFTNRRFNKQ